MYVVGVDPGGAHTGIILRTNRTLINSQLVERDKDRFGNRVPVEVYAMECAIRTAKMWSITDGRKVQFKIERVVPPRWYSKGTERPVRPEGIIDVSIVAGFIGGYIAAQFGHESVGWVRPERQ